MITVLKMVKIEIKRHPGVFITLDKEVAEKIGQWGWQLQPTGYVQAYLPGSGRKNQKKVQLSNAVVWASTGKWPEKGMDVDHIHHDKLDNRLKELRVVPHSINQRNWLPRKGCSSKYKGVSRVYGSKFFGYAKSCGKMVFGSLTGDEEIAARVRDCITYLIGGFLLPNFPDESFESKWERIGGKQRKQILHSLGRNNLITDTVLQTAKIMLDMF
jgi:hypothetical protein